MRSPIVGLRISSVIFALVCLAHIVRLWEKWDVRIGPYEFGHVSSLVAIVISAVASVWLWSLSESKRLHPTA
jgi:uncharacterized membrane protein YccC